MPISSPALFARICVEKGLFLGVNAHYLIASAQLRSEIKDDTIKDDKQVDRIGPFRFTKELWNANRSAEDLEMVFLEEDIDHWRDQCSVAALMAYRAQNRLIEQLGRLPSAIELYEEQWTNEPVELAKLQTALDATRALVDPATQQVTGQAIGESTTLEDVNVPAADPPPDLTKPIQAGPGEDKFVLKAPEIMSKLMADFGLKDFQAAGVLGNIGHECNGFNTMQEKLKNPPPGFEGGFGWCQWTNPGRRDDFFKFCKEQGLDPTSDAANYGNLKRELQSTHASSIEALKPTADIGNAVRVFEAKFEKAKEGKEHFERRDHWAKLAFDAFQAKKVAEPDKLLPPEVVKILDPDLHYRVSATAKAGGTMFWVVDQIAEQGGQALIKREGANPPQILAQDTTVFPLKDELGLPPPVKIALSAGLKPPEPLAPAGPTTAANDDDVAQRLFAASKNADDTLVTRNAPNTNGGRVACAWAVNKVATIALGNPIGGGLSTTEMGKVLKAKHTETPEAQIGPGMVCISPTQGGNVGHVGIVGEIKPGGATTIYSNSSSRGVFSHAFTVAKWKNFYSNRKGLPVLFYSLKKDAL